MSITNVKKLSELASAALATYAYFTGKSDSELIIGLTSPDSQQGVGMATEQARDFNTRYDIKDIRPNDLTGFAATMFVDILNGNKKVLALRGTEFTQGLASVGRTRLQCALFNNSTA